MRRIKLTVGGRALAAAWALLAACLTAAGQQQPAPAQGAQASVAEWKDDFDGDKLDEARWEKYTFAGGGGKAEVKDKLLKLRGGEESRSGVRSRQTFTGERFFVQAQVARVGERAPEQSEQGMQAGTGVLTVLFAGSAATRVEWLLRSDGMFEAWVSVDGRMERIDNRKLATKAKSLWLGIGRKGDQLFFMVNDKVALEHTRRGLPSTFKVMLYGYGTTENNWDSVSVQTLKQ